MNDQVNNPQAAMMAKAKASITKSSEAALTVAPKQDFQNFLEKYKSQIAAALPKHITPERVIRVAMTAISRSPKLLECTKESFFGAIVQASQLGLECDSVLGHAYLVPFRNNKNGGRMEVQFIPGYRGMIDLARRSDKIKSITAQAVRENDTFAYEYGLNETLKHVPADGDRGKIVYFYAYAIFANGGYAFEVRTKADVDKIRARSKSADNGPWATDYEEMGRKSLIRALFKWLPTSVEVSKAMATVAHLDEMASAGESQGLDINHIDTSTGEITTAEYTDEPKAEEPAKPAADPAIGLKEVATIEGMIKTIKNEESANDVCGVVAGYLSEGRITEAQAALLNSLIVTKLTPKK